MNKIVIAKYIRLSMEDVKYDSYSIENQRDLLDKHIEKLEIDNAEILEFVDNGYSGVNLERPSIQALLELVRQSKINIILVKDFSRYARNAIEAGYFIERIFPLYGVRFIAVNDNYDSENFKETTGGMEIAFKFLMHEYYSQDLSKKSKSAKIIKYKSGEYQSKVCIYGYKKGENGRLEPDENAENVKMIFESALKMSVTEILRLLYNLKIPTKKGDSIRWDRTTLLRILHDERYTGMYVAGKSESVEVGGRKVRNKPESEWIRIPDHHPAIISKELFAEVQTKIRRFKQNKSPRDYLFRAKIYCGCCKHAMHYFDYKKKFFQCNYMFVNENSECYQMRIYDDELTEIVFEIIQKQASLILNSDNSIADFEIQTTEQYEFSKQIETINTEKQNLYEKFVTGEISVEEYKSQKENLNSELLWLNSILNKLKSETENNISKKSESEKIKQIAQTAFDEKTLTRPIVDLLIEKIFVYPDNRIEIQWKFSDFAET